MRRPSRFYAVKHNPSAPPVVPVAARINTYTCATCGAVLVTVDLVSGVTPLLTKCETPGCAGVASSAFYRVDQSLAPTHEWYRPSSTDANALPIGMQQHVARGGLLLRKIEAPAEPTTIAVRVLTITQPWATLAAITAKLIETRGWQTSYRGPLAIHAAMGYTLQNKALFDQEPFSSVLRAAGYTDWAQLPFGQIISICNLVSVREITPEHTAGQMLGWQWAGPDGREYKFALSKQERAFGNYASGRYAWLMADMKRLAAPVAARGRLGLWTYHLPAAALN